MSKKYVYLFSEGNKDMRNLLGGKGANLEEMTNIMNTQPGFVKAMWCGEEECEDKVKELTGVGSRCIPFEQETLSDKCVCCGKPATQMVYWGKAY